MEHHEPFRWFWENEKHYHNSRFVNLSSKKFDHNKISIVKKCFRMCVEKQCKRRLVAIQFLNCLYPVDLVFQGNYGEIYVPIDSLN